MKRLLLVGFLLAGISAIHAAAPQLEMVVKRFDVMASFIEVTRKAKAELDATAEPPRRENAPFDLKALFTEMGVDWPAGSYVRYEPSLGKVIVKNTPENVNKVEELLAELNVFPSQIEIEVQFVEFDMADVDALSREGMINSESLMKLRRQGKSKLLSAPHVTTQAGQEACVKGVTEYIYPTEFDVEPVVGPGSNSTPATATIIGGITEPGAFETREVGSILSVMPQITPEGSMIILTLSPELVCEPTWKDYGGKPGSAKGGPMEQPFFHTYTVTTQIAMRPGSTVMMGGGMNNRDGKKVVYIFITARLVDMEGKPLKKREGEK